ncbi:restriction endonuclease subunit S [Francisella philomiragia]|uniref:Type I restriction modification DNA specificity domain protein n=1 Tax=Francisella philomiragia TaxID=28110 RepID=A0A0B6CUS0_9GAMM|nr:restriction endonuclease subunit S [Francisella philomiragia]AJI52595.1 type I restriction modification DNA specificity domain protein [Francisella philomiragia]
MSNIPKLRFKEFSGEFYNEVLDNLIKVTSKKFDSSKTKEIKKCVELEHLSQETGILLGYTNSNEQISIKNSFENGQVLFGKLRPYLKKFWQASFDGVCSSEIWVLNGKKLINAYVYYIVQTNKFSQMANISSGSKMPRADWQYMSQIPFNYPTKPEQQKIASFLTSVDKKIELLTQKEKLLKDYKKGIMQKIFSQEIRFKADDGSEFSEWVEKRLGSIVLLMQSGLSRLLSDTDIGLPVVRSNNLINNKLDILDVKYWYANDPQGANTKSYYLKDGDVLVNFINSIAQIGKVAKYQDILGRDTIFTTNIMRLQFTNDINPDFIFNYFQTEKYKNHIQSITKPAVNQASFTTKDFNKLVVPTPCLEEQNKIANFLSAIDSKIEQVTKQLERTKEFKKGLLQQMFV